MRAPHWGSMCESRSSEGTAWFQCEHLVFPSAKSLVIYLNIKNPHGYDANHLLESFSVTAADRDHVSSFAHKLLRMIPHLNSVVNPAYYANAMTSGYGLLWNTLFSELCQGDVKGLRVYSLGQRGRAIPSSISISGLTCLIQQSNIASAPFAELAHRNAGTLRELRIRTGMEVNWRTFIYGGTLTPTVYSSLASFILGIGNISRNTTWAAIENAVPFPALSILEIVEEYPFADDLLFRGNDDTLRRLRFSFHLIDKIILGESGILNRSGISRMDSVATGLPRHSDKTHPFTDSVIRRQIHKLLESVTTLKLNGVTADTQVYTAIRTIPKTATIQHLELTDKTFNIAEIVAIVSALPSLASLTCRTIGIGPHLGSLIVDKQPSTLHAKHYPLSSNFRNLRLSRMGRIAAASVAHAIIIFAIICPSLSCVDILPLYRNTLRQEVASAMTMEQFQPYIDSLHRLTLACSRCP